MAGGPIRAWHALLEHASVRWGAGAWRALVALPWALALILIGLAVLAAYSGSPNP